MLWLPLQVKVRGVPYAEGAPSPAASGTCSLPGAAGQPGPVWLAVLTRHLSVFVDGM